MSCPVCAGKGMVRLNWADAPEDYGICVCPAGEWYRSDVNAGRHTGSFGWQVWAACHQVEPSRIVRLEDVLTGDELRERGLVVPEVAAVTSESALLSAGKTRKGKL